MGQSLWFLGLSLLPLATVFALEFTIPIWSAIMAVIFLGERMNRGRLAAVTLGFVGILIIVHPGAGDFSLASLVVVVAAIGFAVSNVCTKPLSRDHTPFAIIFVMNLIQMPLGLIAALPNWVWPTLVDLPWIGVIGTAGLTAHFCMTRAFMLADATLVLPIDYLRLPLAAVLGFMLYNEAIELALVIGGLVILGGNLYSLRYESRLHKAATETAQGGA
jgi:drug/metabolite transporter (DMT)-like permease